METPTCLNADASAFVPCDTNATAMQVLLQLFGLVDKSMSERERMRFTAIHILISIPHACDALNCPDGGAPPW